MCIILVFMINLVEINVKGFLWKCAEKNSIYGQNHEEANNGHWILDTFNKRKTRRCNLSSLTPIYFIKELQHTN